jgi:mono/diheme cytochrome c family protein
MRFKMALDKVLFLVSTVVAGTIGVSAVAAGVPQQAVAPPPGPGLALINERCGFCHTPAQATGVRKTPSEWAHVVQSMIDRGAELSPEEQKVVVDYLSTNMAVANSAAPGPAASPTPAAKH